MDTFLVQVWVPADDRSRAGDLRGVVRHVATGIETPFRGDDEILAVLRQATGHWRQEPPERAPRRLRLSTQAPRANPHTDEEENEE